jgi:hypothetical protein
LTKFEAIQKISGVHEYSKLMFELSKKAGTPEDLEKDLSMELTEEGLQVLRTVAQNGNYPLSLEGMQ